jgi:hypothetical protein
MTAVSYAMPVVKGGEKKKLKKGGHIRPPSFLGYC